MIWLRIKRVLVDEPTFTKPKSASPCGRRGGACLKINDNQKLLREIVENFSRALSAWLGRARESHCELRSNAERLSWQLGSNPTSRV